jgi:ADP-ribose pyrophosphatase YjhB (NUDIX family)
METRALAWARRVQAISQIGLTYSDNPFDRERYEKLRDLAAEMLAAETTADGNGEAQSEAKARVRLADVLTGLTGYPTPKVDVRALVRSGGQVLLVQERVDDRWALPGGWADIGSSPTENAVREVAEEAGVTVAAGRLLAVYDRSRHGHPPSPNYIYKLFVACDLVAGEPAPGPETLAAGFFDPDRLPPLSSGRVTAAQIARLLYLDDHPELPPDLD